MVKAEGGGEECDSLVLLDLVSMDFLLPPKSQDENENGDDLLRRRRTAFFKIITKKVNMMHRLSILP